MRKYILSVLLVIAMVVLAGCGAAEKEDTTAAASAEVTDTTETKEITETAPAGTTAEDSPVQEPSAETTVAEDSLLPELFKVAGKSIWVNVPDWKELEYGFTQAFVCIEDGDEFVSVTADQKKEASNVEEAHEIAFAKFVGNIDNQTLVNEMDNITYTNETINGIDVYKYEGTYQSGKDWVDKTLYRNCYIIGYSFISDGIPCTINGVLDDEEQNPDQIAELKEIVEAMMLTVRNER